MYDQDTIKNMIGEFFPSILKSEFRRQNDCDNCIDLLQCVKKEDPLTYSKLNQLLHLFHEGGVTYGFYQYYFLETPAKNHPYSIIDRPSDFSSKHISSIDQLLWGTRRFYTDALFFFGNIKSAYRFFRKLDHKDIVKYFRSKRFNKNALKYRGKKYDFKKKVEREHRYFNSEILKSNLDSLLDDLDKNLRINKAAGSKVKDNIQRYKENVQFKLMTEIKAENTIDNCKNIIERGKEQENLKCFELAKTILDESAENDKQIEQAVDLVRSRVKATQENSKNNTKLYLSFVNDLDIYVATSMRTPEEFEEVYDNTNKIFLNSVLSRLDLRWFDPTNSIANNSEDKGLMECLMVKCAKLLIYFAGKNDSFGKDSEAAMALSLGKPVIIYSTTPSRITLFKKLHPLSRLIVKQINRFQEWCGLWSYCYF